MTIKQFGEKLFEINSHYEMLETQAMKRYLLKHRACAKIAETNIVFQAMLDMWNNKEFKKLEEFIEES